MQYGYLKRKMFLDNLNWFDSDSCTGSFQLPYIRRTTECPEQLVRFPEAVRSKKYSAGVHFFMDDYRIEPFWRKIEKYIPVLKKYDAVLSPDFSLFTDMPVAQQIWNTYRSRLSASVMQRMGINVIPTVSWADSKSFRFCFEAIEKGGIVAVSSVGIGRDSHNKKLFSEGIQRMIDVLCPCSILIYGNLPDYDFGKINFFHFPACKKNAGMVSYMEKR